MHSQFPFEQTLRFYSSAHHSSRFLYSSASTMSYFNAQPTFQGPPVFPSSENEPPKQWNFPQVKNPPRNGGAARPQTHQGNTSSQAKANRKRSSSEDDEQPERQQVFSSCYFEAPTKRRKGLTDATASNSNSAKTANYWGKASY